VITSSENINRISTIASALRGRFSGSSFRELDHREPEAWAKESYEIAVKIAYDNGSLRGTPKGQANDCREINAVTYVSNGYPASQAHCEPKNVLGWIPTSRSAEDSSPITATNQSSVRLKILSPSPQQRVTGDKMPLKLASLKVSGSACARLR
jgi:hypothetical protein